MSDSNEEEKKDGEGATASSENSSENTADQGSTEKKDEGADLLLRNLLTGDDKTFKNVTEYFFNKTGKKLLIETAAPRRDRS